MEDLGRLVCLLGLVIVASGLLTYWYCWYSFCADAFGIRRFWGICTILLGVFIHFYGLGSVFGDPWGYHFLSGIFLEELLYWWDEPLAWIFFWAICVMLWTASVLVLFLVFLALVKHWSSLRGAFLSKVAGLVLVSLGFLVMHLGFLAM